MKKRIFVAAVVAVLMFSFFSMFAMDASAASQMLASDKCVEIIQAIEGFQAIPYWDYAQWTVGFGTECPEEDLERYRAEGIPVDEAQELFALHMLRHEKAVNKFIDKYGLTLNQAQFDALISYTYNLGPNTLSKDSYTIVQAITSGATENELIYAFSIYCMAGGEFQPGLMRRRLVEANMWLHGVYDDYPPESYCYIHYDANGGVRDASAQGYDSNLAAVPLSRPTREGYAFVGWYTEPEGGVKINSLDETHHGMTLYAHWQEGVAEADKPVAPAEGINVTVTGSVVHLRSGPGQSYGITGDVQAGRILTITGTTEADGLLWGKCSEGWICLSHTDYFDIVTPDQDEDTQKEPIQLPAYATIMKADGVTVYNGPHTTYPKLGTLKEGEVVLLEEYTYFAGNEWVRYEGGWIRLTDSTVLIHDDYKLVHNFTITTTAVLVIREEPGVDGERITTLGKNVEARVYAVACVDGVYWGRVAKGWVNLTYSDFDESKLNQYQNHIFGDWYGVVASTCMDHGTERRDCQHCQYSETREAALGDHSYDSWTVLQAPTCTEKGVEQRLCKLCGHSETRDISATGHSMSDWTELQPATCTEAGQEQRSCTVCSYTETREIAAPGHSYGPWYEIKAPTAEQAGEEQRDCQICGHSETRVQSPTEHTYGQWYVTREATCTEAGLERRECQVCGHSEEREVEALGHSLDQWYTATDPTCTDAGEERRNCQRCDHYESRPLDALGHSFGQWYESIAPTYEQNGEERRDCSNCDHYETRQTDKLPAPTVIRTFATITCDALRIRSGPGTSYKWVGRYFRGTEVEIFEIQSDGANDWGRTEDGWICLTGYTTLRYVEDGSHTTHTYGEWYVANAATCTENGERRRDCTVCNHSETEVIPATGHSFGQWYESIAPTTTSYGQERRDCQNCNHHETRETPMLTVELVTKVYATVTCDYLSVRTGPGSSYKRVGKIYTGVRVEILEQVTKNGITWGRTFTGWIWLTGYTTLETVTEEAAATEPVTMTVNADSLTVRTAPGTGNSACGYLYTGAQVQVYEYATVKGALWARIETGWVMAKYLE